MSGVVSGVYLPTLATFKPPSCGSHFAKYYNLITLNANILS